ncbi:PRC-barrel domain-containing protein [Gorillibacterium sp. sgz500922]|uniref:PRC-barrel domain-containing protein n=1 Tax=Gorillibacterium sp. sgz500922 TaxID=3446694 RepID=UPI003F665EA9
MFKGRDLVGLPVIEVASGQKIGTVQDLMFDRWTACCLLLETRVWFKSPRAVEWKEGVSVGEDAVILPRGMVVRDCPASTETTFFLLKERNITGIPVLSRNGQELGVIEDVYIASELDKRILGFELSEGFLTDVTEGRKWLPFPDKITFGKDAVIVPVQSRQDIKPLTTEEIG